MKLLVYGAGALGSLFSARLHEAGHDVTLLSRGARLATLRDHGVQLAEEGSPVVTSVPVPVVAEPDGAYDLIAVLTRAQHVDAVLESLTGVQGDVLFLLNWAAGPDPLSAVLGRERVLLGFPASGGRMDGDVVRYRPDSLLTRLVTMPVGELDGRTTPRLQRVVRTFRSAGFRLKPEARMDGWLRTHAALEVPLGQAVNAAGSTAALVADPEAVRAMIRAMRENLVGLAPVPRVFGAVRTLPEAFLVSLWSRFLRSRTAANGLDNATPAARAELAFLTEQLRSGADR